jgi:hypothetical protein
VLPNLFAETKPGAGSVEQNGRKVLPNRCRVAPKAHSKEGFFFEKKNQKTFAR